MSLFIAKAALTIMFPFLVSWSFIRVLTIEIGSAFWYAGNVVGLEWEAYIAHMKAKN